MAFVIVPFLTASIVLLFVYKMKEQKRQELLNQFSEVVAPRSDAIMTDDETMRYYIRTYGPAPSMHEMRAAAERMNIECHDRAHQLGRMSYEEFGDEILKLNLPECHSGFYHGAIEAYFHKNGTDNLKAKLSFICPSDLNAFFWHQCRHGLGHGLMAWSNYDLPETLEFCNLIDDNGGKASCRTGVYMENIVGSIAGSPQERALGHFTKFLSDDPQFPCSIVKEEYKADCYFLQTDRMYSLGRSFEAIAEGCKAAPSQYHYTCFASMGRTVSGLTRGRPEETVRACKLIEDYANKVLCIDAAAKDQLWDPSGQEAGLKLCSLVPPEDGQRECYLGLLYHAAFVLSDEQRKDFCPQVPADMYDGCMKGEDTFPPAA